MYRPDSIGNFIFFKGDKLPIIFLPIFNSYILMSKINNLGKCINPRAYIETIWFFTKLTYKLR